jgi:hypothetical protein
MKIVIRGRSGMFGRQLWRHFHVEQEVRVMLRRSQNDFAWDRLDTDGRGITGLDATNFRLMAHGLRMLLKI